MRTQKNIRINALNIESYFNQSENHHLTEPSA